MSMGAHDVFVLVINFTSANGLEGTNNYQCTYQWIVCGHEKKIH